MALLKAIELDSGIILNYHRIVTITKITNHSTVLEVAGYTSKAKREQEIRQFLNGEEITVYIETTFVDADYNENATIKDWYEYLKNTERYSGAEDDEDVESDIIVKNENTIPDIDNEEDDFVDNAEEMYGDTTMEDDLIIHDVIIDEVVDNPENILDIMPPVEDELLESEPDLELEDEFPDGYEATEDYGFITEEIPEEDFVEDDSESEIIYFDEDEDFLTQNNDNINSDESVEIGIGGTNIGEYENVEDESVTEDPTIEE